MMSSFLFLHQENRVRYNQSNYLRVFGDNPVSLDELKKSERDPSLSECVQMWLERTPGLEEDGFNFRSKFKAAVEAILKRDHEEIEVIERPSQIPSPLHLAVYVKMLSVQHCVHAQR